MYSVLTLADRTLDYEYSADRGIRERHVRVWGARSKKMDQIFPNFVTAICVLLWRPNDHPSSPGWVDCAAFYSACVNI